MAFFGLKLDMDLEMRAEHPHQKFQGVPPPGEIRKIRLPQRVCFVKTYSLDLTIYVHGVRRVNTRPNIIIIGVIMTIITLQIHNNISTIAIPVAIAFQQLPY